MATQTVIHTDDHDTANLLIHEARALAELLAQIGDVAEDQITHMRTVASIVAEKLEEAQTVMSRT